ncbi:glycosyltransferase [Bradyrhizobium sp. Ec3.3]|uniref:glycosyltransferase n=1 Tax=Bradyrhizobium sp. Ec3.3 TaxID=189753 RepID=UPI00040D54CB|nr:glycosyltransferase family 1 protein [Bradyrhizobium sp. Ec3.3]
MKLKELLELKRDAGEMIAEGDARRDKREWSGAAQFYRTALNIDPSLAHIWVQLGHALKESGHYQAAETAYRKALEIEETNADTFVMLGHLLKISGRPGEALQSYRNAQRISPDDLSIVREIEACERNLGEKFYKGEGTHHLYFDISDLIFYIGHHDNLTGIQRVQASIVLALLNVDLGDVKVHFLTYVNSKSAFYEIDQRFVISLLLDLARQSEFRTVEFDKPAARDGYMREATPFKPPPPGRKNIFCLLGAAWVNRDYFLRLRNMKNAGSFRILFLIHDLIPIFARETCDQGTAEVFTNFLHQSPQVVDQYLCVSESTKNDLVRYFSRHGWKIQEPIVTRNGAFPVSPVEDLDVGSIDRDLASGNYVLFVSTIEGRKNHIAAFYAFEELVRQREDAPYLVCVGRLGWRAEEFLFACEASQFLHGKIKILSDISDIELKTLYQNCLLTIYPSQYEGWGLPVGEALSFGKLCITSNVTSLPEVGGDFAQYVDPSKPTELAAAIRHYLENPSELARWEQRIRSDYKPITWESVASKILAVSADSFRMSARPAAPTLELGREYPVLALPRLPAELMGERMVKAISSARGRHWNTGLYTDEDYFIGQSIRVGEGWCEPESDHTWACVEGAGLAFSVSNPGRERLSIYVAFRAMEACIGSDLIIESQSTQVLRKTIHDTTGHFVIHGIKPSSRLESDSYLLRLTISGPSDLAEKLSASDSRSPAIGLLRVAAVAETDIATRLRIVEQVTFA